MFASAAAGATVTVQVQFTSTATGTVLTTDAVPFTGAGLGVWVMLNFTLSPSAATGCEAIAPGSDPTVTCGGMGPQPGHVCVKCGGDIEVGLVGPGAVNLDFL